MSGTAPELQNPGLEQPIYIESFQQQRKHWYTATEGDAIHRHAVRPEELWNDYGLIPDYPSALWTSVVQQMVNDGDTSGPPLAGPPPILTLRKNKPLTQITAPNMTNKWEVLGPNPIRQVVTATFGQPAPVAPNVGPVVTALAAPTTVQGYTPVIVDSTGTIHPMKASMWVIDGLNSYVEFPYGVPSNMIPPFTLTYFEYTGNFGGGGGPPPAGPHVWHYVADATAPGFTLCPDPLFPGPLPAVPSHWLAPLPVQSTETQNANFIMFDITKGAVRAGGTTNTWLDAVRGVYSAAFGQNATASGPHSAIGGGLVNQAVGQYCTVGGGNSNFTNLIASTVAGGQNNTAGGITSTICGGDGNNAGARGFIGGGVTNTTVGSLGTIGGGGSNYSSDLGFVGGGQQNISGVINVTSWTTIGGGLNNQVLHSWATIGGGSGNSILSTAVASPVASAYGFIGGGQTNLIDILSFPNSVTSGPAVIGGGRQNTIESGYSFIGAGQLNEILIVPSQNVTDPFQFLWNVICGGSSNIIYNGQRNAIGGGRGNIMGHPFNPANLLNANRHNVIAGGFENLIDTSVQQQNGIQYNVIGGGLQNVVDNGAGSICIRNFLGGGAWNRCSLKDAVVCGGEHNRTDGVGCFVGAGSRQQDMQVGTDNNVATGVSCAVVCGWYNTASGEDSFVGAGRANLASGFGAFVGGGYRSVQPAGTNNTANSTSAGVVCGEGNTCSGRAALIGAGQDNSIVGGLGTENAFIGAGTTNNIGNNCDNSAIVAGSGNTITPLVPFDAIQSFIGAGENNTVNARRSAIVAGGFGNFGNTIESAGSTSCIGAGTDNVIRSSSDFIGAGQNNEVGAPPFGATGFNSGILAGAFNQCFGNRSGILAGGTIGVGNVISGNSSQSGIVAGQSGLIDRSSNSFIGAGSGNSIANGLASPASNSGIVCGNSCQILTAQSAIISGQSNVINLHPGNPTNTSASTIICGQLNTITAQNSTINAGVSNTITIPYVAPPSNSFGSCIAAGASNTITSGLSFIAAGSNNTVSGLNGVVLAGQTNTASAQDALASGVACLADGLRSICLGGQAQAAAQADAFVWSDNVGPTLAIGPQSFTVGCAGGSTFYSDGPRTTGVNLPPLGIAWAAVSDRNRKENLVELDGEEVLAKVDKLPIFQYNFKGQPTEIVHRGPVAQDWHELFPSQKDPLRIDTMDLDGISFAAIKGLSALAKKQAAQLEEQSKLIASLAERLAALEAGSQ